jgi:hypothetical protein
MLSSVLNSGLVQKTGFLGNNTDPERGCPRA